jgi:hypothetical protein
MDELRKDTVNIETLLFSLQDREITAEEEEALVKFVRSAHSLKNLSLTYIPPPVPPPPPNKPEYWIEEACVIDADNDERSRRIPCPIRSPRPQHAAYKLAVYKQQNEICRFPLTNFLGTHNLSLRSISLTQHPNWRKSDEDLAYIGTAAPYLTDLAITFPP